MAQPSEVGFGDTGEHLAGRVPTTLGVEATRISAQEVPATGNEMKLSDPSERGHFLLHTAQMGVAYGDPGQPAHHNFDVDDELLAPNRLKYFSEIFGAGAEDVAVQRNSGIIVGVLKAVQFHPAFKKSPKPETIEAFEIRMHGYFEGLSPAQVAEEMVKTGRTQSLNALAVFYSNTKKELKNKISPENAQQLLRTVLRGEFIPIEDLLTKPEGGVIVLPPAPSNDLREENPASDEKPLPVQEIEQPTDRLQNAFEPSFDFFEAASDPEATDEWRTQGKELFAALEQAELMTPEQAHGLWQHLGEDEKRSKPINNALNRLLKRSAKVDEKTKQQKVFNMPFDTAARIVFTSPGDQSTSHLDQLVRKLNQGRPKPIYGREHARSATLGIIAKMYEDELIEWYLQRLETV